MIPEPHPMSVGGEEYSSNYSLTTFINAYYQIRDCLKYSPRSVLVVGVGVGLEPILLREKFNVAVSTFDIDPSFGADYVGSVHQMHIFESKQFDVCIVSHVLEHMPFAYFEAALHEIARVSRHAIIYLPHGARRLEVKLTRAQRQKEMRLKLRIAPFRTIDGSKAELCDGEHYWECGYRNFEPRRIAGIISKFFIIDKMYENEDWHFSLNFCLTSR